MVAKLFSYNRYKCKNKPGMRKQLLIILGLVMAMLSVADLTAQEVVKSDVTESREGKNYYIHTTEAGQTLFAISKAYDVAVDELIFENPDAADGLSIDELLRIPVISREKQISSELRSDDFRFIFHIVKKGETLYSIARIYDVPVADLKEINPEWESGLSTGQYIKIPMKESQLPIVAKNDNGIIESNIHTVGTGETLYSISRKYRVSIPALKAVNPGISNTLSIGQKVHIPVEEQATSAPQDEKKFYEHKVAAKETLYGIARTYRVSIDSLMSFNEGLTKDIFAGEVIRIPIIENETEFITHQVREKTKLKRLASKYALSVSVMKAANPDFRSRLYPGDVIRIPVGTAGDVPQNNVIVIVDRPDEEPPDIVHKHDSIMCYDIEAPYKGEIKVALMIPFYSEETREINISGKASAINPAAIKSFNFIHVCISDLHSIRGHLVQGRFNLRNFISILKLIITHQDDIRFRIMLLNKVHQHPWLGISCRFHLIYIRVIKHFGASCQRIHDLDLIHLSKIGNQLKIPAEERTNDKIHFSQFGPLQYLYRLRNFIIYIIHI